MDPIDDVDGCHDCPFSGEVHERNQDRGSWRCGLADLTDRPAPDGPRMYPPEGCPLLDGAVSVSLSAPR